MLMNSVAPVSAKFFSLFLLNYFDLTRRGRLFHSMALKKR